MHWLTSQRRRNLRRVVHGAAVGDLDRCGYTAHRTESRHLECDNTAADRKSRNAPPMRDLDPCQYSEGNRREVDPPIEVQSATWTTGGQLDWW
jgi:hypothetical protein